MQTETVRKAHSNALIMLQAIIVGFDNAINQSQNETLKSHKCVVHEHVLEGCSPLVLTQGDLLMIRHITGNSSNCKHEV